MRSRTKTSKWVKRSELLEDPTAQRGKEIEGGKKGEKGDLTTNNTQQTFMQLAEGAFGEVASSFVE